LLAAISSLNLPKLRRYLIVKMNTDLHSKRPSSKNKNVSVSENHFDKRQRCGALFANVVNQSKIYDFNESVRRIDANVFRQVDRLNVGNRLNSSKLDDEMSCFLSQ
jgi:hypothetical protein